MDINQTGDKSLNYWDLNFCLQSDRSSHLNFDNQLAKLDKDLEKRLKKLQETLNEMTKGNLGKL